MRFLSLRSLEEYDPDDNSRGCKPGIFPGPARGMLLHPDFPGRHVHDQTACAADQDRRRIMLSIRCSS